MLGTTFRNEERLALLAELETLLAQGLIRRQANGRWVPIDSAPQPSDQARVGGQEVQPVAETTTLVAAPFVRSDLAVEQLPEEAEGDAPAIAPQALLRYWRSALRSDPRGTITEAFDRHGAVWHLISGKGGLVSDEGQVVRLRIALDALCADFRAALLRREANENALAIGWPLAIGRRSGVPAIWPIGLIAAEWRRTEGFLEVEIAADDVLVNPAWLRGAARSAGWKPPDLEAIFAQADGIGLEAQEFLARLRDAAASQIRSPLTGAALASQIDTAAQGVIDAAALFLPEDSSFTAGAVRDLDVIAQWPEAQLARTALAPLVGLDPGFAPTALPAINVGSLNAEQIAAVRSACSTPLTVVTGPPGTGKSQAIVSMAASVLLSGGTVLVASKNHQALDAVQDRLGTLAPDAPFIVRTLDPVHDIDRSFSSVLSELVQGEAGPARPVDFGLTERLEALAAARAEGLDLLSRRSALECEIAEHLERIAAHLRFAAAAPTQPAAEALPEKGGAELGVLARLLALLRRLFAGSPKAMAQQAPSLTGLEALEAALARLRSARDTLAEPPDVIALTEDIAALAQGVLAAQLATRANPSLDDRDRLDQAKADLDFMGGRASPHRKI